MKNLKIVAAQIDALVMDIPKNIGAARAVLLANKDADLVVLPECALTGYPLGDLPLRNTFAQKVTEGILAMSNVVQNINGPALLIGAPMIGPGLPYNAAFLIEPDGRIQSTCKVELPNMDVFDERRTFSAANIDDIRPLDFMGRKLGVMICEDMWHGRVARRLADEGAEILIVLNGSPYEREKFGLRTVLARRRVQETVLPLIYVNLVGAQDETIFDGGSFAIDPEPLGPKQIASAAAFDQDALGFNWGPGGLELLFGEKCGYFKKTTNWAEFDYEACTLGLKAYVHKNGFQKVLLGVSGGLDSAVVLAMAADALGPENVIGVMMPSQHTSQLSRDLADQAMRANGVTPMEADITSLVATYDKVIAPFTEKLDTKGGSLSLMNENLQSRARGVLLMALSNATGALVLSTGNKSEVAMGYCTLYGDTNGGYNPLKSMYKTTVMAAARARNEHGEVIPNAIINRPPSAELAGDQTDEASLGDYEVLDRVLEMIIEQRMSGKQVADRLMRETLDGGGKVIVPDRFEGSILAYCLWVARSVRIARHKQDQAPIGAKTNQTDFGLGWRTPISGSYDL